MYSFNLTVGDEEHNSHCRTCEVAIKSNLIFEDLRKAYYLGAKTFIDVETEIARDDSYLYIKQWVRFKQAGMTLEQLKPFEVLKCGAIVLDQWSYARLWLFVAKLGNKDLEYHVEDPPTHFGGCIGGNGLFDPE